MDNKKLYYAVKLTTAEGRGHLDIEIYSTTEKFLDHAHMYGNEANQKLVLKMQYFSGLGYVFDMIDKILSDKTDAYIYAINDDLYAYTRMIADLKKNDHMLP